MKQQPQIDFVHDYLAWLRDRCITESRGAATVLHTPFLDVFNDGMAVYVEHKGAELVLHDNGSTLENLDCMGLKIADSERRQRLIEHAIAGCAVRLEDKCLKTNATTANLPQRVHFLLNAMSRLNDLWMSATPHSVSDFFGLVKEFLDQQEVLYSANLSIPGRTVEHHMDFVIPLPRQQERLVKLIGAPSLQTAKVISFTWFELMDSRPDSQRVVLVNDLQGDGMFSGKEEERKISEQTMSILSAYSDSVYSWSRHDQPEFKKLWLPGEAA